MFGKVRDWNVSHSLEGFKVRLYEIPRHARWLTSLVNFLDRVTNCQLCGARSPELFWKIPLGRPERDPEGFLENSLAGGMYNLFNRAVAYEWRREVVRLEFPVSDEVGKDLWGEDASGFFDDDDEEE